MRRIKQISVTNLFGMFNYVIPLHLDDRITIIHGPNGFGKTAILRLLNDIFHKNTATLRTIPFNKLRIDFEDGSSFWIDKIDKAFEITSKFEEKKHFGLKFSFYFKDQLEEKQPYILQTLNPSERLKMRHTFPLSMIDRVIPELDRIGDDIWRDMSIGENLSFEDVLERFGERLPIDLTSVDLTSAKEPDWLTEIRQAISIRFIETQRLLNPIKSNKRGEFERHPTMVPTVRTYSEELTKTIEAKLAETVALSQSLDRTFPARVVNPRTHYHNMTDEELRSKLAYLEHKRSRLIATGLLDKDDDANFQVGDQIDEGTKTALSIYVEDTDKKLAVFDDIVNKIELLTSIVNKRFLFKRMEIGKEHGFVFTTENGIKLSPTDLSSGEQHELVLFYELLFKIAPGSLILIDEPELSLHVVWQEQFLQDIQEITRLSNIDVLLATHSPDIISDRRDLVVELEGPK